MASSQGDVRWCSRPIDARLMAFERHQFFESHGAIVSDHLKAYFFERAPTWPAGLNANQRRGMGSYGIIQRLERPQNAQA